LRVGIFADLQGVNEPVGAVRELASDTDERQLSIWLQQGLGYDAGVIAASIVAARPSVSLGISVIPAPTRHPLVTAQLAATLQTVANAPVTVGLGASHASTLKSVFGIEEWSPVETMAQYLDILMPALEGNDKLRIAPETRPTIVLGALLPRMLTLAGQRTDGTVTWLTGTRTLKTHIGPRIRDAAGEAGRDEPQVIAVIPICVTSEIETARQRIDARLAHTSSLPSYKAMLELEAAASPADIAILGERQSVEDGLHELADAGVTTLVAMNMAPTNDDWIDTLSLLSDFGTP
jgi:F420-dependent oxidoreductase-like protein